MWDDTSNICIYFNYLKWDWKNEKLEWLAHLYQILSMGGRIWTVECSFHISPLLLQAQMLSAAPEDALSPRSMVWAAFLTVREKGAKNYEPQVEILLSVELQKSERLFASSEYLFLPYPMYFISYYTSLADWWCDLLS